MKKVLIVCFMSLFLVGVFAAGPLNLGDFPLGKWVDSNYDAVWEFSSNNIRILSPDGTVYCDFSEKTVNDFKVGLESAGATITFSCPETAREYKFIKGLTNLKLTLEINRENQPQYSVLMDKQ